MMLGKDRMAELRSIAKLHNLAAVSQTVLNSVAEIAAAQGQSPPVGPPAAAALPALQCKKLPLKKAKRKAPRVVSDEEQAAERGELRSSPQQLRAPPRTSSRTPPAPPRRSSPLGTFLLQTPQLLKLCLNNLSIRKPLLKPPKNFPPHHHASRLPLPSHLARVVVSTNPHLLLQHLASQLPSKKP